MVELSHRAINAVAGIRQRARTSLLVGYDAQAADGQCLPEAFVVAEQEQAIFLERSSRRRPELISLEGRSLCLIKKTPGIERAVSKEFKNGSMKSVRAGLRDDIDLCTSPLPIFGGISVV